MPAALLQCADGALQAWHGFWRLAVANRKHQLAAALAHARRSLLRRSLLALAGACRSGAAARTAHAAAAELKWARVMHALVDSVFSKWRNALARYRRLVAAIEERERRVMRAILDTLSRLCDSEKRRRFRKLACRGCHVRRVALRSFTHWRAAAEAANWEAHKQSYKRGDGGARASDDDDSPSESPMRAALSAAPAHLDHLRALSTFGAIELHLGRLSTVRGLARRPITVDVAYHWLLEYGFRVYGAPLLPSGKRYNNHGVQRTCRPCTVDVCGRLRHSLRRGAIQIGRAQLYAVGCAAVSPLRCDDMCS